MGKNILWHGGVRAMVNKRLASKNIQDIPGITDNGFLVTKSSFILLAKRIGCPGWRDAAYGILSGSTKRVDYVVDLLSEGNDYVMSKAELRRVAEASAHSA